MKRLTITYGGLTVFDSDVAEYSFKETGSEVTVTGRITARPSLTDAIGSLSSSKKRPAINGVTDG